jgi:hypothetical protein
MLQLGLSHRSQVVDGQVGVHFTSGLLLQLYVAGTQFGGGVDGYVAVVVHQVVMPFRETVQVDE